MSTTRSKSRPSSVADSEPSVSRLFPPSARDRATTLNPRLSLAATLERRKRKLKPKLESSVSHFSFKR